MRSPRAGQGVLGGPLFCAVDTKAAQAAAPAGLPLPQSLAWPEVWHTQRGRSGIAPCTAPGIPPAWASGALQHAPCACLPASLPPCLPASLPACLPARPCPPAAQVEALALCYGFLLSHGRMAWEELERKLYRPYQTAMFWQLSGARYRHMAVVILSGVLAVSWGRHWGVLGMARGCAAAHNQLGALVGLAGTARACAAVRRQWRLGWNNAVSAKRLVCGS